MIPHRFTRLSWLTPVVTSFILLCFTTIITSMGFVVWLLYTVLHDPNGAATTVGQVLKALRSAAQ